MYLGTDQSWRKEEFENARKIFEFVFPLYCEFLSRKNIDGDRYKNIKFGPM
jgi:hypothetical protein